MKQFYHGYVREEVNGEVVLQEHERTVHYGEMPKDEITAYFDFQSYYGDTELTKDITFFRHRPCLRSWYYFDDKTFTEKNFKGAQILHGYKAVPECLITFEYLQKNMTFEEFAALMKEKRIAELPPLL